MEIVCAAIAERTLDDRAERWGEPPEEEYDAMAEAEAKWEAQDER